MSKIDNAIRANNVTRVIITDGGNNYNQVNSSKMDSAWYVRNGLAHQPLDIERAEEGHIFAFRKSGKEKRDLKEAKTIHKSELNLNGYDHKKRMNVSTPMNIKTNV